MNKYYLTLQISGTWHFTLKTNSQKTDWMVKEGIEKGWYYINWNTFKLIEKKTGNPIGKIVYSSPKINIENVKVQDA